MQFTRELLAILSQTVKANKVCVILGARRVGKSELIRDYLQDKSDYLFLNGDDILDVNLLEERSTIYYKRILAGKKLLVIDEAQNIPEIGLKLKLIVDTIPGIAVIATGSSVLSLNQKVGEPLVGRMNQLMMYPLSYREISEQYDFRQQQATLDERLVYGSYPELFSLPSLTEKAGYLGQLVGSLLLKDILSYGDVRKSSKIIDLLKLLAFQMGDLVNYTDLGTALQISKNTVEKYIDLLIQSFIIVKVGGYSKNLRKEISKQPKIYFTDNGIRNAILNNFTPIDSREDRGKLWENYCIQQRIRRLHYDQISYDSYFWRTYDGQEIDWIEDYEQKLHAYEMKYTKAPRIPKAFASNYPTAEYQYMNRENYYEYIE